MPHVCMYTPLRLILKGTTNYSGPHALSEHIEPGGFRTLECKKLEAVLINIPDSGPRQGAAVRARARREALV